MLGTSRGVTVKVRFVYLRHMPCPTAAIWGDSASVSMAHVTSGKDPSDLRYHIMERGLEKAALTRSTAPEGDVAGAHNGLRSHNCFRCLIIPLRRTHWSDLRQLPAGGEFEMWKQVSRCSRAGKQRDSKNFRTGEFGKAIFGERPQP